jgi:hypothetical protein
MSPGAIKRQNESYLTAGQGFVTAFGFSIWENSVFFESFGFPGFGLWYQGNPDFTPIMSGF